jgi:toxin ParE1/3/4
VSPHKPVWNVHLSEAAKADLKNIQRWTVREFGERQSRVYEETLFLAIASLTVGDKVPGARSRDELSRGLYSLHVSRKGRKGRHFLIFRIRGAGEWELVRVLHDSMDLAQHLQGGDDS